MGQVSITVVTTTFRPWDRLLGQLSDLKQQTLCPPFEWIVVDDLKESRPLLLEADFPILHILPHRGVADYFSPAHADNTALLHARGELVYFMNDYVRLTPRALQRHWALYETYGPNVIIAGQLMPMDGQMSFPPRKGDFPLGRGVEECTCCHACWQYSAGRNDSAPLERLLHLNGLDERFDGDRGGSDVDVAQRLVMAGCRYLVDTQSIALEYAHHPDSNEKYAWDKSLPKKGMWDKLASGYQAKAVRVDHYWDIRAARSALVPNAV